MSIDPIDTGVRTDPAGAFHRFEARRWVERELPNGPQIWIPGCACGWQSVFLEATKADCKPRWISHVEMKQRQLPRPEWLP